MKIYTTIISMFGLVCVSACASQTGSQAANTHFQPAVLQKPVSKKMKAANKAPKLKLIHVKANKTPSAQGVAAVTLANKRAKTLPSLDSSLNSIMIFQYEPGELYQIYTTPLNVTDIQLQPGEQIVSVAAGDTLRWQVSKTVSGSGSAEAEHLLVKPSISGLNTTMVVMTNARTYHLLLKSTSDTFMAAVEWQYDDDGMIVPQGSGNANLEAQKISPLSFNASDLNFSYQARLMQGSQPDWMPVAVFDDGVKTYIELPKNVQSAPSLFVQSKGNSASSANYRVVGRYYILDQVIQAAELVSGNGKTIVEIQHK